MGGSREFNDTTSAIIRDDTGVYRGLTDETVCSIDALRLTRFWTSDDQGLIVQCLISNGMRIEQDQAAAKGRASKAERGGVERSTVVTIQATLITAGPVKG